MSKDHRNASDPHTSGDETAREKATADPNEDRTDEGRAEGYHGDADTDNPMAPASAGLSHGGRGTVDPGADGPDQRPVAPEGRPSASEASAEEETPVRSPGGHGTERGRSGSASAAAASTAAGSHGPTAEREEDEETGETEEG